MNAARFGGPVRIFLSQTRVYGFMRGRLHHLWSLALALLLVLCLTSSGGCYALSKAQDKPTAARTAQPDATQAVTPEPNTLTPQQLVRASVANALAANAQTLTLRYRFTRITPHGTFVKDVIETKQGEVSRLVSIDGKPLGAERASAETERLQQLLANPEEQKRHYEHELATERQIDRLMREIPDAFLFHRIPDHRIPDSTSGSHRDSLSDGSPSRSPKDWPHASSSLVHIAFVPNPSFSPPDLASRIFAGMAGEVWIDPSTLHMVRLKAHLNHSIHWGFGLLATFARGGSVEIQNEQVLPGYWTITRLELDLTGTALLFKPISLHLTEIQGDFKAMPASTDWQTAAHLLLKDQ